MSTIPNSQSAPVAHAINESTALVGGETIEAPVHNPLRKGGGSTDWARTAALPWLAGWLPWVLVAAFAAVGGSATTLLLFAALGAF